IWKPDATRCSAGADAPLVHGPSPGHRWYCARHGVRYTEQALEEAQVAITRSRLVAATLAAGDERDEPAALLFARPADDPGDVARGGVGRVSDGRAAQLREARARSADRAR